MPRRFDPRGRVNRALLVGVPEYAHVQPGDLKGVHHNIAQLSEVLRTGDIFDADEISVCSPEGVDDFTRALNEAVDTAEGLLLFYFAGHGAIPAAADELWLQMRNARVVAGSAAVFQGSQAWSQVLGTLASSRAKQVVVILDCCYAGNAGLVWEATPEKRRISQLMSVQANNPIGAGPGTRPTPFTEQLIRVLKGGVDGEGGDVGFHALSEELRASMTSHWRTKRSERWEPQSRPATSGVDVLLATDLPPVGQEKAPPWWRRKLVAAAAAGVAALLVWGGCALAGAGSGEVRCAPPLELRLLTDRDIEPSVRKAAAGFMTSAANRTGDGCRRSGITTYSAGASDVVAAFRNDSGAWQRPATGEINPQRDIGAQPDIWIPAAAADVERARSENGLAVATLGAPQPLASSPIVLAVPEALGRDAGRRTGQTLAQLLSAFRGKGSGTQVRRPDPELTDAALLATSGLYGKAASGSDAEKDVAQAGPPAPTGRDLLCELPRVDSVDDRTAALVPEHLLRTGVGCASLIRTERVAQYPTDVPVLDPSYVRVVWDHALRDADARDEAAESFRKWLVGKDGTEVFRGDGFRGPVDAATGATGNGPAKPVAGTLAEPGRLAPPASADAMNAALTRYRDASGPGSVLFLLDSSGSMDDKWHGPSGAPAVLKQSLGGLGPEDRYGVWAVGESGGASHTALLDFARHTNRDAAARIEERAQVRDVEADPYAALTDAWEFMTSGDGDDEHRRLIVYLTDDEEKAKLTSDGRLTKLLDSAKEKAVPVVVVSFEAGTCDPGKPSERITSASGGRCLDANRSDLVPALRDEVARTGSGDQR